MTMIAPDYEAVRHLLDAPQITARTAAYVGLDDFDFAGLAREAETMSSGEKMLVDVASDLWNANRTVGVFELVRKLDQRCYDRVVEALRIARGPLVWDLREEYDGEEAEDEELAA